MSYRHREEVSFHPLIKALLLLLPLVVLVAAVQGVQRPEEILALAALGLVFLAIVLLFGRMVVSVDDSTLRVEFGYLGWPSRAIPLDSIERAETVDYHPLVQFGGWGIRSGRFRNERTGCYSMRGNRGVLLSLRKKIRVCLTRSQQVLIGCEEPERLEQALRVSIPA